MVAYYSTIDICEWSDTLLCMVLWWQPWLLFLNIRTIASQCNIQETCFATRIPSCVCLWMISHKPKYKSWCIWSLGRCAISTIGRARDSWSVCVKEQSRQCLSSCSESTLIRPWEMKGEGCKASKREATPRRGEKGSFLAESVLSRVGQAQLQRCCRGTAFETFQRKWLLDKPPLNRLSLANGGSMTSDPSYQSTWRLTPLYCPNFSCHNFTPIAPPHSNTKKRKSRKKILKLASFIPPPPLLCWFLKSSRASCVLGVKNSISLKKKKSKWKKEKKGCNNKAITDRMRVPTC